MIRQCAAILLAFARHLHVYVVYQVQDLFFDLSQSIRSLEFILDAENAEQAPCTNLTDPRRA